MNRRKLELVSQARSMYGDILPTGSCRGLGDCFTVYDNRLAFWFNTRDGDTHVVMEKEAAFDQ